MIGDDGESGETLFNIISMFIWILSYLFVCPIRRLILTIDLINNILVLEFIKLFIMEFINLFLRTLMKEKRV